MKRSGTVNNTAKEALYLSIYEHSELIPVLQVMPPSNLLAFSCNFAAISQVLLATELNSLALCKVVKFR